MTMQPSPPTIPPAPILSAHERASIADGIRQGHAIQEQAQREVQQVVEQTNRELAQAGVRPASGAGPSANASVVKDGGGRIVVTGPSGKTIVIDPRVGLDGDQIENMVRTALQPPEPAGDSRGPSKEAVTIVAIVFTFLFLIALVIARTVSGRRRMMGATTAALPREAIDRLARIEQAVEAVAIEVERISEAQRYSAQLLTDRGAGRATMPAAAIVRGDHG